MVLVSLVKNLADRNTCNFLHLTSHLQIANHHSLRLLAIVVIITFILKTRRSDVQRCSVVTDCTITSLHVHPCQLPAANVEQLEKTGSAVIKNHAEDTRHTVRQRFGKQLARG